MVTELSLYWTLHFAHWSGEYHFIEFLYHHPRTEFSQIASASAGGALRVLFSEIGKFNASFNLRFERLALGFGGHENMSSCCFSHKVLRFYKYDFNLQQDPQGVKNKSPEMDE